MCSLPTLLLLVMWITMMGTIILCINFLRKDSKAMEQFMKEYLESRDVDGRGNARTNEIGRNVVGRVQKK